MIKRKSFDEAIAGKKLFIPGIYDAFSARNMEVKQFDCMYLDAQSVALAFCGVPDACLMSSADLIDVLQRLTALTSVPVIVDIDSGFGSEINVIRTCERVEACGATAVALSDKVFLRMPSSKEVDTRKKYLSKLEAAVYQLKDTGCGVIAKIDAYATLGVEETIGRANDALANGACAVYICGVIDKADLQRIAQEVNGPKYYEMASADKVENSYDEIIGMGYDGVIAPYISICGTSNVVREFAEAAMVAKNDFHCEERGYSTYGKFELLKIHEWYALGAKFNDEVEDAVDIDPDDYLKKQQAELKAKGEAQA